MKWPNKKIILSTSRLILRTWVQEDVAFMTAINADPLVMEYFPSTQDLNTTQKLIQHINEQYERYGYTAYAVETKSTGEFMGFVGLDHPSFEIPNFIGKNNPVVEIGWRLSAKHWNKGYAIEAAKAVVEYAFAVLNLKEIIAFTAVANVRSRRVMEKLGMHHDPLDDFEHPKLNKTSPLCRHVLYRLSQNEYQAEKSND